MTKAKANLNSCITSLLICAPLFIPLSVRAETLRQVLVKDKIDRGKSEIANLDEKITSYAILNDPNYFCIAYYLDNGRNLLCVQHQLSIALLMKNSNKWIQQALDFTKFLPADLARRPGSIQRIIYSEKFIYLDTHINPFAGYMVVLSKNLDFEGGLYGWSEALFDDETIVYHNSQVHFAPTHYAELSVYNPTTKINRKIYPLKPYQNVRLAHIRKVKAAYDKKGEEWFRNHNHHMDPELFNNHLAGKIVVNHRTHSLAFIINYDNTDYWSDEDILKLNGFRELRERMKSNEIKLPLPDDLFMSLYEDLMREKRLNQQDFIINLFKEDKELQIIITGVLKTDKPRQGENWRKYLISLNANWDNLKYWQRLAQIIQLHEASNTKVLYIYRNVTNGKELEYKEMLFSDASKKYGDIPLSNYLESDILNRIFEN